MCVRLTLPLSLHACVYAAVMVAPQGIFLHFTHAFLPQGVRRGRKEEKKKKEWIKVILSVCSSYLPRSLLLLSTTSTTSSPAGLAVMFTSLTRESGSHCCCSRAGFLLLPRGGRSLSFLALSLCFCAVFHLSEQYFLGFFLFFFPASHKTTNGFVVRRGRLTQADPFLH